MARLKGEEAAELTSMLLDEARRAQQMRRASIGVIKSAQKGRTAELRRRQRAERVVMVVSGRKRDRRRAGGARPASLNFSKLLFKTTR